REDNPSLIYYQPFPHHILSPFFSKATAPSALYTLSLHDALPILFAVSCISTMKVEWPRAMLSEAPTRAKIRSTRPSFASRAGTKDRKSTRLNSSHVAISYAVFCLKKKNQKSNDYPIS